MTPRRSARAGARQPRQGPARRRTRARRCAASEAATVRGAAATVTIARHRRSASDDDVLAERRPAANRARADSASVEARPLEQAPSSERRQQRMVAAHVVVEVLPPSMSPVVMSNQARCSWSTRQAAAGRPGRAARAGARGPAQVARRVHHVGRHDHVELAGLRSPATRDRARGRASRSCRSARYAKPRARARRGRPRTRR